MFETYSVKELSALLDCFHVPMFAVQRAAPDQPFAPVCSNAAHDSAAGLREKRMTGAAQESLWPADQADLMAEKLDICAATRRDLRFLETFTLPTGVGQWDTTLQHVSLHKGGDRIIGTAFRVDITPPARALQDVWYHANVADLQVQNLCSLLDETRNAQMFCQHNAHRVESLAALSRSVQQAIADIRMHARPVHQKRVETLPHVGVAAGSTAKDAQQSPTCATRCETPVVLQNMKG
ncbi:MAG: hypothetical protein AB8B58_02520 [Roseobacter sp.]